MMLCASHDSRQLFKYIYKNNAASRSSDVTFYSAASMMHRQRHGRKFRLNFHTPMLDTAQLSQYASFYTARIGESIVYCIMLLYNCTLASMMLTICHEEYIHCERAKRSVQMLDLESSGSRGKVHPMLKSSMAITINHSTASLQACKKIYEAHVRPFTPCYWAVFSQS